MAEKDMLDIFEGLDFFAGFKPDPQAVEETEVKAEPPAIQEADENPADCEALKKMAMEATEEFNATIAEDIPAEQETVIEETPTETAPTEEAPVEATEASAEEPKKRRGRPRKKKEEIPAEAPAEEKIEEVEPEPVVEETMTEEPEEVQVEEPKIEEKPKASKKKKVEVIIPAGEAAKENTVTVTITTSQTYRDIINALNLLPPVDENFLKIKDEIQEKMNAIRVHEGMTRTLVEHMSEKIDELNFLINGNLAAMKTAYENLANKDDGILARVMAKGGCSGANEIARKANGIKAAEEFISPSTKEKVDLFWAVYATRYAKNFYEAASEQLENKRRLLKQQADFITMKAA